MKKEYYTGPELARILGYTRARIWQLTRDGVIPAVKIGRDLLYTEETRRKLEREGLPNARARPGVRAKKKRGGRRKRK